MNKAGSTIPVKLQLCDASNSNISSSNITVAAQSITQTSMATTGALIDPGNANPDNNFRFDATLGTTGGYIYNLSTKGLSAGSYTINFTVRNDPTLYTAPFHVQ